MTWEDQMIDQLRIQPKDFGIDEDGCTRTIPTYVTVYNPDIRTQNIINIQLNTSNVSVQIWNQTM